MELMRSYRRYRHENKYDAPLLIYVTDACLWLGKVFLLVLFVAGAWIAGNLLIEKITTIPTEPSSRVQPQSVSANPSVSSLESRIESLPGTTENFLVSGRKISTPPDLVSEKWILDQNRSTFTIQFGSSPDIHLLEQFISIIDTGLPVAIYPYKKTPSGRNVYGLATGLYSDLDTALSAVESLSDSAKAFGPWVRPMTDLQNQVKRTLSITSD